MATTISGGAAGVNTASTTVGPAGITFGDATVQTTAAGVVAPVINVYTSSGTWTKPATVRSIKVTVIGGGGAGGSATIAAGVAYAASAGGGGGGGGTSTNIYPAPSLPGPQPYTVGAAGATSSFGVAPATVISATGGSAGSSQPATTPTGGTTTLTSGGAGGAGSSGALNISGSAGTFGSSFSSVPLTFTSVAGGIGGSTVFGGGGSGSGGNYGGGGGGGSRSSTASANPGTTPGGTGAQGVVIVEEFY